MKSFSFTWEDLCEGSAKPSTLPHPLPTNQNFLNFMYCSENLTKLYVVTPLQVDDPCGESWIRLQNLGSIDQVWLKTDNDILGIK